MRNDQRPKDPYLGLSFWVEIDGLQIAGFAECSGISIETEVYEYSEGGLNTHTHKLPVRTKYANITLKRGIDAGQDLYRWYMSSLDGNPKKRKNVTIQIFGQKPGQKPVQKWDLIEAWPVKWTGPDLKSEAGATAIETLEFAHNGINVQAGQAGQGGAPTGAAKQGGMVGGVMAGLANTGQSELLKGLAKGAGAPGGPAKPGGPGAIARGIAKAMAKQPGDKPGG